MLRNKVPHCSKRSMPSLESSPKLFELKYVVAYYTCA